MSTERYLIVPTEPPTWIPLGISDDDFAMLMDSFTLWKPRIVAAQMQPHPAAQEETK